MKKSDTHDRVYVYPDRAIEEAIITYVKSDGEKGQPLGEVVRKFEGKFGRLPTRTTVWDLIYAGRVELTSDSRLLMRLS